MKILWLSPHGDGWSLAAKLREAGHRTIYFCPDPGNQNGDGLLPRANGNASWKDYAAKSDLVVVDGNFPSRRTRRSLEASDFSYALRTLSGPQVQGPVPTTELLESDTRYLRKILHRAGLGARAKPATDKPEGPAGVRFVPEALKITASWGPADGLDWVFRHRHLLGGDVGLPGNGPELGNLGDVVLPASPAQPLAQATYPLVRFLRGLGYQGYVNLDLAVEGPEQFQVERVFCRFLYPAVFIQFGALLGLYPPQPGVAVSLLRFSPEAASDSDHLRDSPGFFGAEVHTDDSGRLQAHGEFVGACVGTDEDWTMARERVNRQLTSSLRPGWGFRPNVGDSVAAALQRLTEWGWIS